MLVRTRRAGRSRPVAASPVNASIRHVGNVAAHPNTAAMADVERRARTKSRCSYWMKRSMLSSSRRQRERRASAPLVRLEASGGDARHRVNRNGAEGASRSTHLRFVLPGSSCVRLGALTLRWSDRAKIRTSRDVEPGSLLRQAGAGTRRASSSATFGL
jgi:hypothetical protein